MRYAATPFPAYAFVPGRAPHPRRDPRGHSHEASEPARRPLGDWRLDETWRFGVDLYNHGYLWEAHEAWEGLWHAAKHDELQAEHLQGLIQCAAGVLKVRMQQPRGLARLTELGTGRLERVAVEASPVYMGAPVAELVSAFRAFAASEAPSIDERPVIELD